MVLLPAAEEFLEMRPKKKSGMAPVEPGALARHSEAPKRHLLAAVALSALTLLAFSKLLPRRVCLG